MVTTLQKSVSTSRKGYEFKNTPERVKRTNENVRALLKKNQKRQNQGLHYAAHFEARQ